MTTKEQVLAILLDTTNAAVSGESLAAMIGVSRNAIWKAVNTLRAEGYRIEAATNRGYQLRGDREPISAEGIERYLATRRFGRISEIRPVIDSTNARARALAIQGAPEGTMVAARGQTNGRGRAGRRFHSPADAGVYVSFVVRPQGMVEDGVRLTALAAVAVARAIERIASVTTGIKWVNDIQINGKKVAGILCESEVNAGRIAYAVIGIGINVSVQEMPDELKDIATSIGNVCGYHVSKNRLIAELCACMEELIESGNYMEEYRARSCLPGRRVRVSDMDSEYIAEAVEIAEDGALIVRTDYGTRAVRYGDIRILEDEEYEY